MSEQEENTQGQKETKEVNPNAIETLTKKLDEIESRMKEKDSEIVRTQQENATLNKILADRNQKPKVKAPVVHEIDKEIDRLEKLHKAGEIDSEELASKSLSLIKRSRELGVSDAVSQVEQRYAQMKEVETAYTGIFKDPELKDFETDMSDLASGYLQGGIAQGMTPQQATEFAKSQLKIKVDAFKSRFTPKEKEVKKEEEESQEAQSGFKGEGEGSQKTKTKEKPITPEESLDKFVSLRGGSRQ